jgi:hypothetical protein
MLVYTTLFTLGAKNPMENKYIDMFYIWLSYLKKYSGLGPNDCVGLIVDEDTMDVLNSRELSGYISQDAPFSIEISIMMRPVYLKNGLSERYNKYHFTQFTKHDLHLYLDIDCLCIKNIHGFFSHFNTENSFFAIAEGDMKHPNYRGDLLTAEETDGFPGFSAGWYAWTNTPGQEEFFATVLNGSREWTGKPFYTVDQPFYNRELFLYMTKQKQKDFTVCVLDEKIVAVNPLIYSPLAEAYFVNFPGEPGVANCHYDKMLGYMCMDFTRQAALPQAQAKAPPAPAEESEGQPQEEEHGPPEAASAAPQEEGDSRSSPPSP